MRIERMTLLVIRHDEHLVLLTTRIDSSGNRHDLYCSE